MDVAKKAGLGLLVASCPFLLLGVGLFVFTVQHSLLIQDLIFLSGFLLILSGLMFAWRFLAMTLNLGFIGKILLAVIIITFLFAVFAPTVQESPSATGYGEVCNGARCEIVNEWVSSTEFNYCFGAVYSYDTIQGLILNFNGELGCPIPSGP